MYSGSTLENSMNLRYLIHILRSEINLLSLYSATLLSVTTTVFSPSRSLCTPVSGVLPSPLLNWYQQYRAFVDHSQASTMTTLVTYIHGFYTTSILPVTWILDADLSHHMNPALSLLINSVLPASPISISSTMSYPCCFNGFYSPRITIHLKCLLCSPITLKLLLISQLSDSGFDVLFSSFGCCTGLGVH